MAEVKIEHPKRRKQYVYRIEILERPPETLDPRWVPPDWDGERSRWPRMRTFLTKTSAGKVADTLEDYGCRVAIRRSALIDWSGGKDVYRSG